MPDASGGTDVILPLFAESAVAAPKKMLGLDSHPLAHRKAGHSVAQGYDFSSKLVASLVRFHRMRRSIGVQVTAANPGRSDSNQNFSGAGFRRRKFLQSDVLAAVEYGRFHKNALLTSPC
jgi:hypothetical protein